ncbi:MAG: VWA domain-containing protein [Phycisphaerae bacterium]
MRFVYQEWDGEEFQTQEHLEYFQNFMDFLMDHGDHALEALREAETDPEQQKILDQWIKDGLLDKVGARFRLTPRAIDSIQRRALMEVFQGLRPDAAGSHETAHSGLGGERMDHSRPFTWGDPVSDVDQHATLRNTLKRVGIGQKLELKEDDLEVHVTESKSTCSTVILLDMSGSMSRWNRFREAKRCAMAVHALIRQRFAQDTVDVVGFGSAAEVIQEHRLPLVTPKQVSIFDPVVRMKVPITGIADAPQHFTNLHMGLRMARQILARRGGRNKQVFIITDGQPTAHVEGDYVHLLYPPEEQTAMATLAEAVQLARQGIRFSTFALIEDYAYMDWVSFVDHLAKLTRGVAFYTTAGELSQCVMESYLSGRKRKSFLA